MSRLQQFLDQMGEQNRMLRDHLDRVEESHEKTNQRIDKMAETMQDLGDAIVGLTHAQQSFMKQADALEQRENKLEEKFDKYDDRLRLIEQAAGVNSVFTDINKNKIQNSGGLIVGAIAVIFSVVFSILQYAAIQ